MNVSKIRFLGVFLAALATVSLAACGGGGSGGGSGPTTPGGGSTPPSANLASCTDPNYDTSTYQGIAPCLTVTGLASGQSVSVSDGSATLTESSNGTYTFPGVSNGTEAGAAVNPTVNFSITATTGGATCSLSGGGATAGQAPSATAYAPSVLCAKYPAVNPGLPKITTMPGASGSAQVIASPVIVPVYISTGSLATGNEANDATFLSELVSSQEWGLLAQYGVGAASVDSAVTVNPGSWSQYHAVTPSDLSTIAHDVESQGDLLSASTVLVIYLPPTVGVDPAGTYGTGYTGTVAVGSVNVPFEFVIDGNTNGSPYSADNSVYWMAEAELVNDVTGANGQGYAWMSANPDLWLGASAYGPIGTETLGAGTLCVTAGPVSNGGAVTATDISTGDIMPIWSQSDAAAGRDPCQPQVVMTYNPDGTQSGTQVELSDPTAPFMGVVTQGTTAVTGTLDGISRTDQAIVVAPGQTITVQAEVFATQPIPDQQATVSVVSYVGASTNGTLSSNATSFPSPLISVSAVKNVTRPSATGVNNGDTIEFTITASSTPFKGMYVLEVSTPSGPIPLPIGVTNGATWH
jgi:hypothetical protein